MKTNHFICKVQDSLNNYNEILSVYCDFNMVKQAETFFKNHDEIKKYIGKNQYQITFQQNPDIIQYPTHKR